MLLQGMQRFPRGNNAGIFDLRNAALAAEAEIPLKVFEGFKGTAAPVTGAPPQGLLAFYWHFVKQTKGWYAAMFAASLATAALDTVIPLFIGRLVSLMEATDRMAALEAQWPMLVAMVVLVLVARPLVALDRHLRSATWC